ncbi:MAG: 5-oxoprolinase subunit B family protein [Fimbriimonas sp.]
MTIRPLGEAAFLLGDLPVPPYLVAQAWNVSLPAGMIEAVASYDTVAVYVDPDRFDPASLRPLSITERSEGKRHRIPVCYALGPDLDEVAARLGLAAEAVVHAHAGTAYRCAAVGFRPGFAYLGDLPDPIAGLPRRAEPRVRLDAGSVGITGRQTGVYPQPGPGGWWLIGRTPLTLVDPDSGYYPIQAGDEVEFVPIDEDEYERRRGERL